MAIYTAWDYPQSNIYHRKIVIIYAANISICQQRRNQQQKNQLQKKHQ